MRLAVTVPQRLLAICLPSSQRKTCQQCQQPKPRLLWQALLLHQRRRHPPFHPAHLRQVHQPQPPETSAAAAADTAPAVCTGTLELSIVDLDGHPIPNLKLKILIKKKEVFKGATDGKGKLAPIQGLPLGSVFEIRVKRDAPKNAKIEDADGYRLAAIGTVEAEEIYACLKSPKTRFQFSTEKHEGAPGKAEQHKQDALAKHNQKPLEQAKISGNPDKKPELQNNRNTQGQPKSVVVDGIKDWFGRNRINAGAPAQSSGDLEKVKALLEFAETQAGWKYDKDTISAVYIAQMMKGSTVQLPTKEKLGYQASVHQCNKYVKIALWKAGFGPATEAIGNSVSPARAMGPALIAAGFQDVTSLLPDARWAAPGDVIVYERKGAPNDAGHIDIRSYDGYISDFIGLELPISKFNVTGIYRKYYDPLPEKRMRAFLKVIASREAETVFINEGYPQAFYALPIANKNSPRKFSSFDTHPFANIESKHTPSGAYGITKKTWENYQKFLDIEKGTSLFSPTVQDRIAITIMEKNGNALGLVRRGQIEAAANILAKRQQWTSLPAGAEARKFTDADMMSAFNTYLAEIK